METSDFKKQYKSKNLMVLFFIIFLLLISVSYFLIITNETLGIILSISILIVMTMLLKWNADIRFVFFGISIFVIMKLYGFFNINPITGPDSEKYFGQVEQFNSFSAFIKYAIEDIQQYGIMDVSSYTFFGLFYMPYYFILNLSLPQSIALFNSLAIISIILFWNKTNIYYFKDNLTKSQMNIFLSLLVLFLFISPSMSYWSSAFLKDILSLFLGVLAFFSFSKKKYIITIFLLILAIALRPYAIVFIGCFWIISTQRYKLAFWLSIVASIFVVYIAGFTGLVNSFPTMLRILTIPNPFSLSNWENLFFPTAEGLIIFIGLSLAFLNFISNPQTRKFYYSFVLCLFIYSCTLTLVGHTALLSRDLEYGLLSAGDDMFRKKLPFMLVIYTMIAYTISTFKIRLRLK
ncbi:hypothetical protein [Oceanobacillus profundus]|uniref:hypothetical protein n=1 Tax=Oceanobacillus profundus TaxID=372463 RepID=UPI0026E27109|nr:hypothetical protein [Oceanobacillus profundus]MDO6450493.1 hypothetical protein [Oceanobacillus profundus]